LTGISLVDVLSWLLAAFFLFGAFVNTFPPAEMKESYSRWGYPGWFHFVTAILEMTVALLLIFDATRLLGALLGSAVMLAAVATTLRHKEYMHTLAPLAVMLLTTVVPWLA